MSYRSIDVDIIDEDQLVQEELFAFVGGTEIDSEVALKDVQAKALTTGIENPPYGSHKTDAKEQNTKIVMEVLNSIKATDIPSLVKNLTLEQQDVLMKYIYRGMASPELYNSAVLLNWHEKLTEVAGVGCIVR
ncbi:220_t:CDS:2, partial [Scutellospora calospora]